MTLREMRDAKALAQIEVAAACGVTIATVSQWETGATQPKPQNIRKLAEFHGVSIQAIRDAVTSTARQR